jgi:hypothetical protein
LRATGIDKRLDDCGGAGAACMTSPLWVLGFSIANLRYKVSRPKISIFAHQILNFPDAAAGKHDRPNRFARNSRVDRLSNSANRDLGTLVVKP